MFRLVGNRPPDYNLTMDYSEDRREKKLSSGREGWCHSDGTKHISGGELQLPTLRSLRSSSTVTSVLLQHSVLSVMSLEGVSREGLVNVLRARTSTHVGVQCTRQEWSDRQASLLTGGLAVRSVVCHLMFIQQYKGSPTFLKTRRKRTISQVTAGLLGPDPVFVHLVPLYIKDRTASITKDFLSPPSPLFRERD